jgi:endoglucanase
LTCAAVAGLLAGDAAAAQTPQSAIPREAVCAAQAESGVPAQRLAALQSGFSIPGWTNEEPARPPQEETLRELRQRGFRHIRLPIRPEDLSPAFAEPFAIERKFAGIDRAVAAILRLAFAVSIDMHPGEKFNRAHRDDPAHGAGILREVWQRVAARYRHEPPDRVFFEVLNEPNLPTGAWNDQGPRLAAAIREVAPRHTLIYGPANFQRIEALAGARAARRPQCHLCSALLRSDVLHAPGHDLVDRAARVRPRHSVSGGFDGCRAGAAAARPRRPRGLGGEVLKDFRTPWTPQRIEAAFAGVAQWALRHRRPVIVNEFGALSFEASPAARAEWIHAVRSAAERFCFGWTHWDYADGFGFVKRRDGVETVDPRIAGALIDR